MYNLHKLSRMKALLRLRTWQSRPHQKSLPRTPEPLQSLSDLTSKWRKRSIKTHLKWKKKILNPNGMESLAWIPKKGWLCRRGWKRRERRRRRKWKKERRSRRQSSRDLRKRRSRGRKWRRRPIRARSESKTLSIMGLYEFWAKSSFWRWVWRDWTGLKNKL